MHYSKLVCGWLCFLPLVSIHHPLFAQIVPDRTLTNNSQVTKMGDRTTIDGGTTVGQNLFHSFQEFSVTTGTAAYFNNPATINNIITRITGSSISNIDGLIRTNGSANLFLLNPNGISFGANAQLDINGSFFATTAEAIIFENQQIFSATNPENSSLLTVNVPIGLQFGATPGTIQVQGAENGIIYNDNFRPLFGDRPVGIEVSPTSTFGLIGGQINFIGGNITTRGGRVELGSVGGNNTVTLLPVNNGWTVDYSGVKTFHNIELYQGASVDASGPRGGDIQLQGQSILLYDGSVVAANPLGELESGGISIKAVDSVILSGFNSLDFRTSILNEVDVNGSGNGGFVTIETSRLLLQNGAVIALSTFGSGDAGPLLVNATESIEMRGIRGEGISSLVLNEANEEGTGNGSLMTFNTKRFIIEDGGSVSAGTFSSVGTGGSIIVNASELLQISGVSQFNFPSEITARGGEPATNTSGSIVINAGQLVLTDRGKIDAPNFGLGDGGNVTINADNLRLQNQGSITTTTDSGNGGNIDLNIGNELVMRDRSIISTEAGGTGNGGNMAINADTIVALSNSDIIANAFAGSGGQIQINTQGIFGTEFRANLTPESDITASSRFGLSGTVVINNPEVNPTSGLLTLSDEVADPTTNVDVGCAAIDGNSFTITGQGGIPEDPTSRIQGQTIWRDLRDFSELALTDGEFSGVIDERILATTAPPIVEATNWRMNADGKVELVAVSSGGIYPRMVAGCGN